MKLPKLDRVLLAEAYMEDARLNLGNARLNGNAHEERIACISLRALVSDYELAKEPTTLERALNALNNNDKDETRAFLEMAIEEEEYKINLGKK